MNNDQNLKKRGETTAFKLLQAVPKDTKDFLIKLGYTIATPMEAIAPQFLNPTRYCYGITSYQFSFYEPTVTV
ncbi:hypothetical protein [Nostoc sp.]|uniref:hypothetical protein n=1 Tax=Nostoc sp. TaxID=1180 RepID=UPI002FF6838F